VYKYQPMKGLREKRRALGLKAEELAALLGCTVATVYRWERGRQKPLPVFRRRLQEIFAEEEREKDLFQKRRAARTAQEARHD
jgi:transcriptional regulator with XRE-family HTH domain